MAIDFGKLFRLVGSSGWGHAGQTKKAIKQRRRKSQLAKASRKANRVNR